MSDHDLPDLPDLPSDEELGITEEDLKALEEEAQAGGGAPPPPPGDEPPTGDGGETPPSPVPGETPPAPGGGVRGPLTLLVLLGLILVSIQWWALPSPVPANAPDTAFSSARAMSQLVEIANQAHPTGSPEHERVRTYLLDELEDLGLEPTVQTTTGMRRGNDMVVAATVRNILVRIPGTASTGTVLLTAHYDGRGLSRAAGDDGMGVVAILETARALLEGPPRRNDVLLLITDAEELGLLGARAFVEESPYMDDVAVALSVEMRGGGGASVMFETGADNGWIVRRYAESARVPFANSLGYEVYRRMPRDTDFTPLKEAGVQGLNFAGIGRAHLYHQAYDAPEQVSEATLQHHGLQLLSMTRALAEEDLGAVDAPSVTYFTVPFWGMVVYGGMTGWAVGAALLLLFALVLALARKRDAGWDGIAAGVGITLVTGLATWGAGVWLMAWLPGFHPEQGALHGSAFHSEGWYLLALAGVAFALFTILLALARRRFSLGALSLGAAGVPVVAALVATFLVPLAAMNLQWPALAALLATAAVSGVGPRARAGWVPWVLALLLTAPVLVFLVFLIEGAWLALSLTAAPLLGVLVVVALALLVPALDALREPNPWWAPVGGLVAAGAFLGLGILLSRPAPERPLPTTLSYALDRESGEARWLTQPSDDDVSDPTADPARSWAVERVDASFDERHPLPWFTEAAPTYPATEAPVVEAAEPQLSVALDSVFAGVRRVRLALRSEVGAEMVLVELPESAELTRVNDHPIPRLTSRGEAPARPTRLVHWGRPQDAILVELRLPSDAPTLSVAVVEHLLRPQELLGEAPWRRPPDMAPNVVRYSDRAMIRTPLEIALSGEPPGAEPQATDPPSADTSGVDPGR